MSKWMTWAALAACGSLAGTALAGGECCEKATAANGWCGHCKVGYFDGVSMKSEALHKALSGEKVESDKIKCDACKRAAEKDGECSTCHVRFAGKLMYRSMVGYHLALGKHVPAKEIKCETCKKASADHGWCDACGAGMVGCCVFKDKAGYDAAVKARATLVAAVKAADKCEPCAVAMVTDGKCERCMISYKDGKPATP